MGTSNVAKPPRGAALAVLALLLVVPAMADRTLKQATTTRCGDCTQWNTNKKNCGTSLNMAVCGKGLEGICYGGACAKGAEAVECGTGLPSCPVGTTCNTQYGACMVDLPATPASGYFSYPIYLCPTGTPEHADCDKAADPTKPTDLHLGKCRTIPGTNVKYCQRCAPCYSWNVNQQQCTPDNGAKCGKGLDFNGVCAGGDCQCPNCDECMECDPLNPGKGCIPKKDGTACGVTGKCSAGQCKCDDSLCQEPECQTCAAKGPMAACTPRVGDPALGLLKEKKCYQTGKCTAAGTCVCDNALCDTDTTDDECSVCTDPKAKCQPIRMDSPCGHHGKCSAAGKCECDDSTCADTECQECGNPFDKACKPKNVDGTCSVSGRCSDKGKCKCADDTCKPTAPAIRECFECNDPDEACVVTLGKPCMDHGKCNADGECVCDDSTCKPPAPKDARCFKCSAPDQACVATEGEHCGTHSKCDAAGECKCDEELCQAEFGDCFKCGADDQCVADEGKVCGQHGKCDDKGACQCDNASCDDASCQECKDPFTKECAPKNIGGTCGTSGRCSDKGICTCADDTCNPTAPAIKECFECNDPDQPCVAVEGKQCQDAGRCAVDGQCQCDDALCKKKGECYSCKGGQCMVDEGSICGSHGICNAAGACKCSDSLCEADLGQCYSCSGDQCVGMLDKACLTPLGEGSTCIRGLDSAWTCKEVVKAPATSPTPVTECPPEPEPECYKDADCMVEGGSTPDKCQTCVMGKCMDKCPGGFCNADKGNKCEAITKPECESVAAGGVWNTATGTCECFCSKWTSAAKKCTGIRAHPFKTEFCSTKFAPGAAVVDPGQWYAAYGPGYIGKCTAPGRCQCQNVMNGRTECNDFCVCPSGQCQYDTGLGRKVCK